MTADQIATAEFCLQAAYNGSLGFPEIVGRLIEAGFESYAVDYRRNTQTFYLPDGESVVLDMPQPVGPVAKAFDARRVADLVFWAQSNAADYSFAGFGTLAKQAGCAGYIVSFLGRRVVYLGRTAETHVEHFPA